MLFVKRAVVVLATATLLSCASQPQPQPQPEPPAPITSNTSTTVGGMTITDEMIGRSRGVMALSRQATDPAYAYQEKSPVKIGGGFGSGSDRTYQFLNALRGPNGETLKYRRVGTCCSFKTTNSPFGEGLLEVYEITIEGGAPKRLYFNWYEEGDVLIPLGLSATR